MLAYNNETLQAQLDFCFDDRSGDVYQYKNRQIPELCKLQPNQSILELCAPIGTESLIQQYSDLLNKFCKCL